MPELHATRHDLLRAPDTGSSTRPSPPQSKSAARQRHRLSMASQRHSRIAHAATRPAPAAAPVPASHTRLRCRRSGLLMATDVKAASCQPRRSHAVVGGSTRRLMVPSTPHSSRPLSRGRRDENVCSTVIFLAAIRKIEKRSATRNLGISENFAQLHRYSPLCPAGACTTSSGRIRPQDPRGPPQDPRPEVTTRRSPQSREQPQDPRRRDTTRRSPSRERGRQKLRSNHRIPAHHHEIPAHQRSACGPTLALGCSRRPSVPQVPPMQRFDLGDLRLDRQGGAGSGSARPRRNSR